MSNLKKAIRMARYNTRITPKLQGWLVNHPNGVHITTPETMEVVKGILMPEVSKSRAGAFHPSQLYTCPRAQVYGFHGVETTRQFNPQLQNLFNDGHFRHLRWQITLLEAGILTRVEVPVYNDDLRLEGSIDGVNDNEKWIFELKGTSQFKQIQQRGAMSAHIKQVHAYMLASGFDSAVIVYEDKSTQDWAEMPIDKDPKIIKELWEILEELNHAINTGEFPEAYEDCKNQTGSTFNNCPYSSICNRVNRQEQIISAEIRRK